MEGVLVIDGTVEKVFGDVGVITDNFCGFSSSRDSATVVEVVAGS